MRCAHLEVSRIQHSVQGAIVVRGTPDQVALAQKWWMTWTSQARVG